jgi:osmotically-inducible protein OsmY
MDGGHEKGMNLTSLITLPARLGYEATRRTLDLAAGAGRLLGLFGSDDPVPAATQPKPAAARRPSRPKPGMDDVTLARKVENEISRVRGVAKGKIDVNAADGVVWLRGEAKTPELIKRLEARAAAVPEVARVENLLHLPKTPAPSRTDTPPAQRRTRTESDRTAARATKAKAERAKAQREATAPAPTRPEDHDMTLTREVEMAVFADGAVEQGSIDIHAAAGTVWLRGTARDAGQMHELLRRCFSVTGVRKVENSLLVADATAPAAGERAGDGDGEPLPSEPPERGEGREPVPLGAGDDAPGGGGDVRSTIP